jgi:hypothetical protein
LIGRNPGTLEFVSTPGGISIGLGLPSSSMSDSDGSGWLPDSAILALVFQPPSMLLLPGPASNVVVIGEIAGSSKERRREWETGAVDECKGSMVDAVEPSLSCRVGECSRSGTRSLLLRLPRRLPLPLATPLAGVALLLVLPCRSLAGSTLDRFVSTTVISLVVAIVYCLFTTHPGLVLLVSL